MNKKKIIWGAALAMVMSASIYMGVEQANAQDNIEDLSVLKTQNNLTENVNLIKNGDFSKGFENWSIGGKDASLKTNEHGNYVSLVGSGYVTVDQTINIDPNSVYEVSYSGYGSSTAVYGNGSLQLNKWTSEGGAANTERVFVQRNDKWQKYSTIVNSGDIRFSRIGLQFNANRFQMLKFTDVTVKKIEMSK
ncbi:carbohydrate binding domain-containing protein [Candidatus Enterococcus ikei]|uniref:CBM-cenC domain-containing protein n=1 Tax=Candidatus Enterococcus ikei TaxID=2815326 RepID=A0ABS3GVW6_9ENTE|nr:carbohydrate binding domain-containing protein [Enterococcus sp. DIV0869a]MBO0439399.1 hypothetical protein [Enterococcus sp. DIV0869a]